MHGKERPSLTLSSSEIECFSDSKLLRDVRYADRYSKVVAKSRILRIRLKFEEPF